MLGYERRVEFWFDGVFFGFGWGFVSLFERLKALPGMLHPNHIPAEFIKFVWVL